MINLHICREDGHDASGRIAVIDTGIRKNNERTKVEEIGPRKQLKKSACEQKNSIFSSRFSNEMSMGDAEGKW